MLTSSNGNGTSPYLRPDYLTPSLPTTLDAKKSPLALLAQTCSQIGADPPVILPHHKSSPLTTTGTSSSTYSNPLHSSLSTSTTASTVTTVAITTTTNTKSKSLTSTSKSLQQNPPESNNNNNNNNNGRKIRSSSTSPSSTSTKRSHHKVNPPSSSLDVDTLSSPLGGSTSFNTSTTPTLINGSCDLVPNLSETERIPSKTGLKMMTSNPRNSSSPSPSSSSSTSSLTSNPNKSPVPPDSRPSSSTKGFLTSMSSSTTSFHNTHSSSNGKLNLITPPSSLDLLLMKHGLPFQSLYPPPPPPSAPPSSGSAPVPPYLHSYARLKAAAAAASASTPNTGSSSPTSGHASSNCRDPFCTTCHIGLGFGLKHGPTCPIGCLHCELHGVKGHPFSGSSFLPFLSIPPSSLAGLYGTSTPFHHQPYVCNWFIGESYCGKRFTTSDDLLQHLRSHTAVNAASGSPGSCTELAMMQNLAAAAMAMGYHPSPPGFYPPVSPSGLYGNPAHHHPGLLSRTYPTPPLSPLSSARFHPYANTTTKGTTSSTTPTITTNTSSQSSSFYPPAGFPYPSPGNVGHVGATTPAFSPYYPYSLYGQHRLGGSTASLNSLHP